MVTAIGKRDASLKRNTKKKKIDELRIIRKFFSIRQLIKDAISSCVSCTHFVYKKMCDISQKLSSFCASHVIYQTKDKHIEEGKEKSKFTIEYKIPFSLKLLFIMCVIKLYIMLNHILHMAIQLPA